LSDNAKQSFWATVPGIITAVAGLLSSVGALIGTLYAIGVFDGGASGQDGSSVRAGTESREQDDRDGDGRPDITDAFAFDPGNGRRTPPDISLEFAEVNPETQLPLGFTGVMVDKVSPPEDLFDPSKIEVSNGSLTVEDVDEGDPSGPGNNKQRNAFLFGIDPRGHRNIFAHTRVEAPNAPEGLRGYQQMGLFIGRGDQDNYVKLVWQGRRIQAVAELGGKRTAAPYAALSSPPDRVHLYLTVDTGGRTVQASYRLETDGVLGEPSRLGDPIPITANWWGKTQGLAVGIIASSYGKAPPFTAVWDVLEVRPGSAPA
jgi:hypothetical protein